MKQYIYTVVDDGELKGTFDTERAAQDFAFNIGTYSVIILRSELNVYYSPVDVYMSWENYT